MLYILGGTSRSGKSTIARRFVEEKQTPFFCTDFLINALLGAPTLGITHEGLSFVEKAEKLWPLLEPMLAGLIQDEPTYLIEGDGILPKNIAEFQTRFKDQINVCFVGFTDIDPQEKFKQVRDFAQHMDDWTHKVSDADLLLYMNEMIEFSQYLKSECELHDIQYFDCSHDFENYLEEVFLYMTRSNLS